MILIMIMMIIITVSLILIVIAIAIAIFVVIVIAIVIGIVIVIILVAIVIVFIVATSTRLIILVTIIVARSWACNYQCNKSSKYRLHHKGRAVLGYSGVVLTITMMMARMSARMVSNRMTKPSFSHSCSCYCYSYGYHECCSLLRLSCSFFPPVPVCTYFFLNELFENKVGEAAASAGVPDSRLPSSAFVAPLAMIVLLVFFGATETLTRPIKICITKRY